MGHDEGPLEGLRVLDLTRVLAGPLCTMLLGDLGAWVIKVERPDGGDESRGWGPPFAPDGKSAYYLSVNRNKLSVALDLDRDRDRQALLALLAEADVVVDNFRPGTLERRGIDPAQHCATSPRLVWCTITGFGRETNRPGYDFVAQAECGWMAITGEPDGAPMKVGVALADVVAGKDAAVAILAALVGRDRGANRRLTISLADSARAALVNVAQNALVSGDDASRWGNAHPNLVPYQLFHAADRPFVIAVGSDAQWDACARAIGLARLADDSTLATNAQRVLRRRDIVDAFEQTLGSAAAEHWGKVLDEVGVPNGVVRSILDVVGEVDASAITGMPSSVGGRAYLAPPELDQHGTAIRARGWNVFLSDL